MNKRDWLEIIPMDDTIVDSDPNSFANVDHFTMNKVHFNLGADFDQKIFKGNVDLTFHFKKETCFIILDTRDLKIHSCKLGEEILDFQLQEKNEALGTPLKINLKKNAEKDSTAIISIHYETDVSASGLQCTLN